MNRVVCLAIVLLAPSALCAASKGAKTVVLWNASYSRVSMVLTVDDFDQIYAYGNGHLTVVKGDVNEVCVEVNTSALQRIPVYAACISAHKLLLNMWFSMSDYRCIVRLQPQRLAALKGIYTSLTLNIPEPLVVPRLILELFGSADMCVEYIKTDALGKKGDLVLNNYGTGVMRIEKVDAGRLHILNVKSGSVDIASGYVPYGVLAASSHGSIKAPRFDVVNVWQEGNSLIKCLVDKQIRGTARDYAVLVLGGQGTLDLTVASAQGRRARTLVYREVVK